FGPDGDLYFTLGGRGSQGGVYRVLFVGIPGSIEVAITPRRISKVEETREMGVIGQPLSAFGRAKAREMWEKSKGRKRDPGAMILHDPASAASPTYQRLQCLNVIQEQAGRIDAGALIRLAA